MQIRGSVLGRGQLWYRSGSGRRAIRVYGSGTIIGTDPSEAANLGEHSRVARLRGTSVVVGVNHIGPVIVRASKAGYEHDVGRAGTTALKIYLAPSPMSIRWKLRLVGFIRSSAGARFVYSDPDPSRESDVPDPW